MINYSISQFGETNFGLKYNDQELKSLIGYYIQQKKNENTYFFTYLKLCKHLLAIADQANELVGKEAHVYYQTPDLSQKEYTRISRLLWDFILDRKIFVDFSNNAYIAHYENDTVIGIINNNNE